jgi:hypothetical protein
MKIEKLQKKDKHYEYYESYDESNKKKILSKQNEKYNVIYVIARNKMNSHQGT